METTIQREKLEQAVGILEERDIDCWLTFVRETSETPDPVLKLIVGQDVTVTWQSVAGVNYFIQRATHLAVPGSFATLATNIRGQAGTTSYTDTNSVSAGPFFYRVGVSN